MVNTLTSSGSGAATSAATAAGTAAIGGAVMAVRVLPVLLVRDEHAHEDPPHDVSVACAVCTGGDPKYVYDGERVGSAQWTACVGGRDKLSVVSASDHVSTGRSSTGWTCSIAALLRDESDATTGGAAYWQHDPRVCQHADGEYAHVFSTAKTDDAEGYADRMAPTAQALSDTQEMSAHAKLALLLSTLGSAIAGSTDVTSDSTGYVLVILQNLCSAFSLTFSKESALSSMELVLLNSMAGSLICSILAYHLEYDTVLAFPYLYDRHFLCVMGFMCCVCVLYQFSIFMCTLRNSALATSVTGNVKDLVSTVCGFLYFPDVHVRAGNIAGVVLSFIGAYSFSYLKYQALVQARGSVVSAQSAFEHKPKQQ